MARLHPVVPSLDGVLVVDKPAGPTSHDVVARVRRALGVARVGHTGTLDPMATGVLPLVVGRATRLARFLSSAEKAYDAVIRLGYATDTCDAAGQPEPGGPRAGPASLPGRDTIGAALSGFLGIQTQVPPAFSAKKVGGVRAYRRARCGMPVQPPPVRVVAFRLDLGDVTGDLVRVAVTCSAGFYVRALARDLGARLGTGGHLAALRRVRSGEFTDDVAVALDVLERDPAQATRHLHPLSRLLVHLPAVALTADGLRRAVRGQDLGATDVADSAALIPGARYVRLLDERGTLVGIAEPGAGPGLLHPAVVLV